MTVASKDHLAPGVRMWERVQARLPQMSPAMRKIAALLREQPSAPLHMSITELARTAGASPATVTRFCRLLGYSGYVPFRVAVAADLGRNDAQSSWQADIGRAFDPHDPPADLIRTLLTGQLRSLRATADGLDVDRVSEVADAIATCGHLDIYGIGGSGVMAEEMAGRLYRIGIPVHAWHEVHAGLTSAAIQGEGDVAIGISNTGRTEETIQMLAQARGAGALAVALTSNPSSPLAHAADLQLTAYAPDGYLQPDDLAAKHAQLFVLDLLYLLVAQRNLDRATSLLAASARAVSGHRHSITATPPRRADRAGSGTRRRQETRHA